MNFEPSEHAATMARSTRFRVECHEVGVQSASAGFRFVAKAPEAYRAAYAEFCGPPKQLTRFDGKLLSLRLSAIGRGMMVDSSVTESLLERIEVAKCPVTRERLRFGGGKSPRNPSVDRLVNEVSYVAGNICMLSQRANTAKDELPFEEVLMLAQSKKAHRNLSAPEWLRLASLMYGAWSRAYRQSDPYLLPLAADIGPCMLASTSQVVQHLLTRHFGRGGRPEAASKYWLALTRRAGCNERAFLSFRDPLAKALAKALHAGDVWVRDEVFQPFSTWYLTCLHVVPAEVEAMLSRHQGRAGEPAADELWVTGARYHS